MEAVSVLLTAEEFQMLPDDGQPKELVRGRIVPVNVPTPRHGEICSKIVRIVGAFVEERELGRVVCNDSGVVTERGPDTVRGADVAYFSYLRVPKGPMPPGYLPVVPELVFEVRSPTTRWKKVLAKVVEYLNGGVAVVCVVDQQSEAVHAFFEDQPTQIFRFDEELELPELLPNFRVKVRRFFE